MGNDLHNDKYEEVIYSERFNKEFELCKKIIYSMRKRYYIQGYDQDDWLQEGRIIFWRAKTSFDDTYGTSIDRYFSLLFERHVISLIRKQSAEKRNFGLTNASLEEGIECHGEKLTTMSIIKAENANKQVIIRESLQGFASELSLLELAVWRRLLEEDSPDDISEDMKITVAQVKNAIDRIKRKMKETL